MSQEKWHIGKNGPAKCNARVGHCPLGVENDHYPSAIEAQAAYEKRLIEKHGTFSSFKAQVLSDIKKMQKEDELITAALSAIRSGKNLLYCFSVASEIKDFPSKNEWSRYFYDDEGNAMSEKDGLDLLEKDLNDYYSSVADEWMQDQDMISY